MAAVGAAASVGGNREQVELLANLQAYKFRLTQHVTRQKTLSPREIDRIKFLVILFERRRACDDAAPLADKRFEMSYTVMKRDLISVLNRAHQRSDLIPDMVAARA
ncbi:MAG: hypothetical protein HZB76_04710 [Chlamydiae bacterium]|nr:hypothetical protein [Chlamydiota bacterium]